MNLLYSVLCLLFSCARSLSRVSPTGDVTDPDVFRNISQLITSKGYPVEEHQLVTPDGYILGVQRIPHGRSSTAGVGAKAKGPPVLLHHGLFSSGVDFVYNFPDQSLGFVLADSGYDVWITNVRGTKYSRKHVSLSPNSAAFWRFSWDEMALVDLPATIDFVLNITGQEKLFYVGHSMGTTVIFALLSDKPEYNQKIRVVAAMAPVALVGHMKDPMRYLVTFMKEEEFLLELFVHGELFPDQPLGEKLRIGLCRAEIQICYSLAKAVTGMSVRQLNLTRVPVYLASTPDGTSAQTLVHYGQLLQTETFQKFDFGTTENMKKYNQSTPPIYELQKISAPMALLWGLNDQLADPVDVNLVAQQLKSLVLNYQVPYPEWGHDDFAIGLDANKLVYQRILRLFHDY